jgi:acetylornithine deacetylase/succinyl-diaminopimelate desuccinylase-like protein
VIRIPNLTSDYDPTFLTNGLIHRAIHTARDWILFQSLTGATVQLFEDPLTYPVLLVDIPSDRSSSTTAIYGHIDKMPHLDLSGWSPGLSPTTPILQNGCLYGRGTADDCYSWYLAVTSVRFLQTRRIPHPRIVILVESSEESGENEFLDFLREMSPKLGVFDRIFILDGGGFDFLGPWFCNSLRGIITARLNIQHLIKPCRSGRAIGIVPSSFRIARMLLDRIEDAETGDIRLIAMKCEPPESAVRDAERAIERIGDFRVLKLQPGARFVNDSIVEGLVKNWWTAGLEVTGADGIPPIGSAGNVLRERTDLLLSIRIPPSPDSFECGRELKEVIEKDPPYGAKVVCHLTGCIGGWKGKELSDETENIIKKASKEVFGELPMFFGGGASVPITNGFQGIWPNAEVLVTGVSTGESNSHGYDENINLEYTIKWTAMFIGILGS